ncbi:restriction endonuclease subunit S [Sorangium sp. So ce726]|uniref:restriction endonuclease subunit S n=1 Tax=Sorangium sp. So ce726 TaxID=3133319 RepID=UPI003F5D7799
MTPDAWMRRRVGDFSRRLKRINIEGIELEPLSITKDWGVILQSQKYRKRIATDLRKYVIAERDDFAFDPMSLYYGAIGRVKGIDRGVVSPDYVVFGIDGTVDGNFLEYLLRDPKLHRQYETLAEGGNQFGKRRRVYWSVFEGIELVLPTIGEQRKIAAILSAVDDAIEATQAVIDQLQVVKKAMMAELLTRGLPGRHTRFKKTEIGEVPEEWEFVLLDTVARRGSGHTPSKDHPEYWDGDIKWISLKDSSKLDRLYITETASRITPMGIANSSAVEHPIGTVVLSRDAGVGKSAITTDVMAVSQHFMAWTCGPRLNNHYLYYWLQMKKPEFERIAIGNTIKTIGLPYFKNLRIPIPPLAEQATISSTLTGIDLRIFEEERTVEQSMALKAALLSALLSGEIRVTPDEASP